MPDQKLDAETEARIREACGSFGWVTFHEADPDCCCRQIRAAILAEREARAAWDQATNDVAKAAEQDLADERAHADALAECLRDCEDRAELGYAVRNRRLTLLAAHDKRGDK